MSRGIFPRVNSLWILSALFLVNILSVNSYSCHEVRTAYQLRQIGSLQRVPETPGTDADLLVCKHQGPSCCTRKMEENYQSAIKRETLQNVRSYSFELKYLLSHHKETFQDTFQYLLSFSQGHLSSLLESSYGPLSRRALPHVNQLFSALSRHIRGHNVSVEAAVHRFYDHLFPLAYGALVRPDDDGGERSDCLRMTQQDVNPFGPHPAALARELAEALGSARALGLALEEGLEVMNATEHVALSRECARGLLKMAYCSHCRGLTLIKACVGYCLNVLRGCLASVGELDAAWRRHTALLEQLTHAVAGQHSLELALLGARDHVDAALRHAQLHGPLITATVDKVCGPTAGAPSSVPPTDPGVATSTVTSSSPPPSAAPSRPTPEQLIGQLAHLKSSVPLKPSTNDKHTSLRKISREFLMYIQRYKLFFASLPEMLCEGENLVDDSTCWSGDDVVESYTGKVVGNGLLAQRQNPEVKVRSANPVLAEVKERLERFNQQVQESLPGLGQKATWEELGSGEVQEGSSTECDDEDGCQGSGDATDKTFHTPAVSTVDRGRDPGKDVSSNKPPMVRVRGGSTACLLVPWSVLLLATLGLQWTLF